MSKRALRQKSVLQRANFIFEPYTGESDAVNETFHFRLKRQINRFNSFGRRDDLGIGARINAALLKRPELLTSWADRQNPFTAGVVELAQLADEGRYR
jgi:hypothetical protein